MKVNNLSGLAIGFFADGYEIQGDRLEKLFDDFGTDPVTIGGRLKDLARNENTGFDFGYHDVFYYIVDDAIRRTFEVNGWGHYVAIPVPTYDIKVSENGDDIDYESADVEITLDDTKIGANVKCLYDIQTLIEKAGKKVVEQFRKAWENKTFPFSTRGEEAVFEATMEKRYQNFWDFNREGYNGDETDKTETD